MVKLDRIDQPIFAGNNASADDNVAVFGSMKTSPSYTMDLPTLLASADYQKGWQNAVAVGYAPFLEEMNGVQYCITYQLAYLQQQGVSEWTGTTTYYKGSLAKLNTASGCKLYASKIDNNTGNLLTDTNSWKLVFDSSVTYANDANVVKLTGSQNVGGIKTFTDVTNFNGGTGASEGGEISIAPINNNNLYQRGFVDVWAYDADDEDTHCIRLRMEGNSGLKVFKDGHAELASSPVSTSDSYSVATTAWVNNKINSKLAPNVSSRVTITSSIGTSNGYTAPSNGFITVESTTYQATVKLIIGDYIVAQAYNYQGDSHGNQQTFLCCPIGRGQTVRYTRNSTAVDPALAYFIPYA